MARVNSIVEIDAGEDGEHVGLQERHQRLERYQDDDHRERQHAAGPAERAHGATHQDDEAGEHLQRDVAGQHVGEQAHAMRDRARNKRQDFDRDDQRQDIDRHAFRYEQVEEVKAVPPQSVSQHGQEHGERERGGDDDVAGNRESVGHQPEYVERQNEHEDREHEREKSHAFVAGGTADRGGDEFVGYLGGRLQARRHHAALGGADHQEGGDAEHGDQHESGGIGESDRGVADLEDRKQVVNLELLNGVGGHGI